MFKKLKIKKLISLLLVFLLSINNFISYATSNDGSSFITKAEFDSLKNTFQSQLDEYNKGIDNKIDAAISAYLAGVTFHGNVGENLWDKLVTLTNGNFRMLNVVPGVGSPSVATKKNFSFTKLHRYHEYYGFAWILRILVYGRNSSNSVGTAIEIGPINVTGGALTAGSDDILGSFAAGPGKASTGIYEYSTWRNNAVVTDDYFTNIGTAGSKYGGGKTKWQYNVGRMNGRKYNYYTAVSNTNSTNVSTIWEVDKKPNGNEFLRFYNVDYGPLFNFNLERYVYKECSSSTISGADFEKIYARENGRKYDDSTWSATGITLPDFTDYATSVTSGTQLTKADDFTTNSDYYKGDLYLQKTNDGKNYENMQWGNNLNTTIYYTDFQQKFKLESSLTSTMLDDAKFYTGYISYKAKQENDATATTIKYKEPIIDVSNKKLYQFIQSPITSLMGRICYMGCGVPVLAVDKNFSGKVKCVVNFKVYDSTGAAVTSDVIYQASNKEFNQGALNSGAKSFASGTISSLPTSSVTFYADVKNNDEIWLNFYPIINGYTATIDSITFSEA